MYEVPVLLTRCILLCHRENTNCNKFYNKMENQAFEPDITFTFTQHSRSRSV